MFFCTHRGLQLKVTFGDSGSNIELALSIPYQFFFENHLISKKIFEIEIFELPIDEIIAKLNHFNYFLENLSSIHCKSWD